MSLRRLGSVIRKEVLQIVRDRRTLATIISLPITHLILYGYLSNDVTHTATAVFDQSRTPESRRLLQAFANSTYVDLRYYTIGFDQVRRLLDGGEAKIGIFIPPDYARRLKAGRTASVEVIVDASEPTSARTVLALAAQVGQLVPPVAVSFIQITVTLLLASLWLHMPIKASLLLLYVLSLAFFFSTLGIGTLISAVSKTFQQATQMAQLVLLPSILISGFIFPRESLPQALQLIGGLLPLTYFVIILRGILIKGVGIEYLWHQILPLVGLGVLVFVVAIRRFQKRID